jgi:HlyD family secretion protein
VSRRTKIILAVVALVIVGGIVAAFALGSGGGGVEVETAFVEQEDLAVTVTASGQIASGVSADVYPPTAGILDTVDVEDGERVMAGATLAVMDLAPLEAAVLQAESALAQAESQRELIDNQAPTSADVAAAAANVDAAWAAYQAALVALDAVDDQGPSSSDIAAAEAATQAAWTAYRNAKTAYELLKASIEASAAPSPEAIARLAELEAAMEQAYAAYLQAKAAEDSLKAYDDSAARAQAASAADQAYAGYLAARAQYNTLTGTSLSAQYAAADAAVDQARQALVAAQDTVADAQLTAPIDGVVTFNAVGAPDAAGNAAVAEPGVSVSPASAPFTVVDMDGVEFVAEVDEVDVDRIELGMEGLVTLDAFPARSFKGLVVRIEESSRLTATGGTVFPVHIAIEQDDEAVLIGMKGDVGVEVSSVTNALTIPVEALFDEGGTSYVYLVQSDDTLARSQIEIGTLTETKVEVLSGIEAGDEVALSGPVELVDGMRVQVAE